ncbi:MAG: amino acid adenylation domain protein [Mucilaginibacter sp.]|nr:amino acid adenylation domain protein [Mucilaginibacter sp.]
MPSFVPVDFDPFAEVKEIEKIIFTNESQREIWLACIFGGDDANLSYNESVSLEINGNLDFNGLKRAVNDLIIRHEALRSTVSPNGETLIIYRDFPVEFELEDISGLNEAEQKEYLKTFIRRELAIPFNLSEGPLFKVFLQKLNNTAYHFTIIKHHVIGDGWSTGIMLEDISKMYNAYSKGEPIYLDRPYQISDYVTAQANFKKTEEYKQTEDFWLDLYKDEVPVLDLPTDFPRPSPRTYKGNRIDYPMPKEFTDKVKAVGAKAGCSLVTTLLAAFEVFLYQQTDQTAIVVGLPSSGQSASGLYDLVGNCVNLLPLKSNINTERTFYDYLKKRKGEVLDAYDHQRLTFGELIKKLYIPRDNSRITLVPVVFNIDMGMDSAVSFDNLQYKLISNPREYENFEIFLNATGSKEGIVLEWSYNTALFTEETIEKFNSDYGTILEKIIADPEISITDLTGKKNDLAFPTADEIDIPSNQTLNTLIADSVKNYAKNIAVSFNDTSLTYKELNEKVNQFSSYLISTGVKPGDIIGLSLERSVEMLISLLAVLKTGAVYLPLDPEYPLERIEFMLEDSSAKLLLTSKKYKNKYKTTSPEIVIDEIWPGLHKYPAKSPENKIKGDDLAYILYTSGSTGKPKGVKITHHNLVNFLLSMQANPGIKDTDRLLAITTISFDIAGLELYLPLISGAEIVLADDESIKDGRILLRIIEDKGITMMQATPSTWQMMLDSGWEKPYPIKILSGGEALPRELAHKLLNLSDELWNMYGPTETTIWSTVKKIMPGDNTITIGFPIYNTQVYIMDEEGKPLPVNEEGELYIGGDGVAEGYLNREELTAEKFVTDTYTEKAGAKLYRTGDLGKILSNGEIQCLGRIDQQVKIRGHRIELGEIESILSAQDGIKQSVVVAYDDPQLNKRLIAYVILNGAKNTNETLWKENLNKSLPNYMVPEEFIVMESFPLTPNAKIDRKALPKSKFKANLEKAEKTWPRNENERLVANIWSKALGLQNLGIEDDFFELGGHSLIAIRVMIAIEKETGKRLPLATLFDNSTIEKLALRLAQEDNPDDPWDAMVPIKASGKNSPLFFIHGAGLNILFFKPIVKHFDAEQPLYGIQAIGLAKKTEIPPTIEEIAYRYAQEIVQVDPVGPYSLVGYSLGGIFTVEVARHLEKMGKEVKFIGVFDTYVRKRVKTGNKLQKVQKKIFRQFHKIPFFVNSFLKYPKETMQYQLIIIRAKFLNLFSHYNPDAGVDVSLFSDYERGIYDAYNKALDNYTLTPFNMKINLFRVEKRLYYLDDLEYLGWNNFALKGVDVHQVSGDHHTLMHSPNDKKIAAIIQKILNDGDRK